MKINKLSVQKIESNKKLLYNIINLLIMMDKLYKYEFNENLKEVKNKFNNKI